MRATFSSKASRRPNGQWWRGVVTIEMIAALPILAFSANIIFHIAFDAAFVQGMSFAAIEAAREGAKVFPESRPFLDPQGEPSVNAADNDDIADTVTYIVLQRLGVLVPHIRRANGNTADIIPPGIHVRIRRGAAIAERGDLSVPINTPTVVANANEIEVFVAVRTSLPARSARNSSLTAEWVNGRDIAQSGAIRQATARAPLE